MRWLPVNLAAQALHLQVEEASAFPCPSLTVYNLENAIELSWSAVVKVIISRYPTLRRVSMEIWLKEVANKHGNDNRATELLDFLENYVRKSRPPKLQLDNASRAVGDLLCYKFDEGLLDLYIRYVCRN